MKSLLLQILLFLSLNHSNLECRNFKTGTFEIINIELNTKYIIERNSEFQTEEIYNLKSGEKISGPRFFNIKWVKDCEYNLMLDTTRSKCTEFELYINTKGGLNNKISKIENNCAYVITTFEGKKFESQVYKIK